MIDYYKITNKTMAILPAFHMDYSSKIIEVDTTKYFTESPLQIIKSNCLVGGAAYEGRKKAVTHHLPFHQKTPIPINISYGIYAFPTKSPKNINCSWLFFHSIEKIITKNESVVIEFKNGQELQVGDSVYTLQKQYDRTGMCKVIFENGTTNDLR
ncbi:competence protein ComK [Gracilibacillus sp. D59]|uniref:competence protein ComK n=1 Tax=Gracilibacillus sp. D59 TaxID=3457434 RepID=UPI003FCEDEB1